MSRVNRVGLGHRAGAAACALMLGGLTSCDLAPNYKPPSYLYPNGWEGKGVLTDGHPSDQTPRADWWKVFGDPELDALEERLQRSNPDLQASAESYTQERDIAREAESQLYPQVSGSAGGTKNKSSLSRLWRSHTAISGPVYESNEQYSGVGTWEPDFWDRIRNNTHMYKNQAQASAAYYASTRLILEAELASDYIGLRGIDAQNAVYDDSVRYYQTAVQITRLRQEGAISPGLDVSRAQDQLFSTMAAQSALIAQRQVLEHAIAVLVNTVPAAFHIAPSHDQKLAFGDVRVSAGLPSQLLERRPDVAEAERQMAAASRAIGVSRAAFYPNVVFSASGGFQNDGFDLASIANAFWTYGVQAVEPVFTGGLRRAGLQRAWAQYRQTEDEYRSTVLGAFQDVEDGLSESAQFRLQQGQQEQAVAAALRTQRMTMALYTGGLTNYLDAVIAQEAALLARIAAVQAQTSQLQATVRLIRAVGGGWDRSRLPTIKQIDPFGALQYDGLHHASPAGEVPVRENPAVDNNLSGDAMMNPDRNSVQGLTRPAGAE